MSWEADPAADLVRAWRIRRRRAVLMQASGFAAALLAPLLAVTLALAGARVAAVSAAALVPVVAPAVTFAAVRSRALTREVEAALAEVGPTMRAQLVRLLLADPLTDTTSLDDLLAAVARQASRAEVQAARAVNRADMVVAEVRQLTGRRLRAEEQLLTKLTAELHDTTAQSLIAAKWALGEHDVTAAMAHLTEAEQQLRDSLGLARTPELGDGLAAALRDLIDRLKDVHGVRVEVSDWPAEETWVGEAAALALYRFLQESLRNVAKHSGATRATVSLKVHHDLVVARVRDDGVGFDAQHAPGPGSAHFGLGALTDRARAVGGWFGVRSVPGVGTTTLLVVPVRQSSGSSVSEQVAPTVGRDNRG